MPLSVSGSYTLGQSRARLSDRHAYIVSLDVVLAQRKLDLFVLDDQVNAEDATSHFAAVGAMADMTASLLSEEVVIVYLHLHLLAKTFSFHVGEVIVS